MSQNNLPETTDPPIKEDNAEPEQEVSAEKEESEKSEEENSQQETNSESEKKTSSESGDSASEKIGENVENIDTEQQADAVEEAQEEETPKETHPLDAISDQELIKLVDDLKIETKHLNLENTVFEHFLKKNDATLITGMAQVLEAAKKLQQSQANKSQAAELYAPNRTKTEQSIQVSNRSDSIGKFGNTTITSLQEKGPRINISQKTDLVMRETEEMQVALDRFIKRSHRAKCNLRAELEEFNIRDSEVKESMETFEQTIVVEGVEKLTQRIPAEKFLRYMEEWLRSAEFTLEKMRLRTSTLFSQYSKVSSQLVLKEEIGEMLHAVDFEQLQIKNQHALKKIEEKNVHLLELKRINGRANLMLTTQKQFLQDQMNELANLKAKITATEKKTSILDEESERAEAEVEKAQAKYEEVKELSTNYAVPDVLNYIKKKANLYDRQKSTKIWSRRTHIQKIAIDACTRQMKVITGLKRARESWYSLPETSDDQVSIITASKSSLNSKPSAV